MTELAARLAFSAPRVKLNPTIIALLSLLGTAVATITAFVVVIALAGLVMAVTGGGRHR